MAICSGFNVCIKGMGDMNDCETTEFWGVIDSFGKEILSIKRVGAKVDIVPSNGISLTEAAQRLVDALKKVQQ